MDKKSGDKTTKKSNKTINKTKNEEPKGEIDIMQSLLSSSQFEEPVKKKTIVKQPKTKDIEIDLEKDSQEEIIKKLVLSYQKLKTEFEEYKQYVEGTYCTISVHDRQTLEFDKSLDLLKNRLEDVENEVTK
jgi:hypothetical protein